MATEGTTVESSLRAGGALISIPYTSGDTYNDRSVMKTCTKMKRPLNVIPGSVGKQFSAFHL